jgi:hypothetical protein
MAQPVWITEGGDLGIFPSGFNFLFQFQADPVAPAVTITYSLLNGSIPQGTTDDPITFSPSGRLGGTPINVSVETTYSFTIRATDNLGNLKDRTFSMRIFGYEGVSILTDNGSLLTTYDSKFVEFQIEYFNPIPTNKIYISQSSGELPPGISMDENGLIRGYPTPPTLTNGSPTQKTYNFTVQLISELGNDTKNYSITVRNWQLNNAINTRVPVILNDNAIHIPVDPNDIYYGYYVTDNIIPTIRSGEYFNFKIIGHDFDNSVLIYQFGALPSGLTGDTTTGWITGTPNIPANSINKYEIYVNIAKVNNTNIVSKTSTFILTITNDIAQDVEWVTDSNLGIIDNGQTSELYFEATSSNPLYYTIISGTIPPNMSLLENGQLIGKVPFQPNPYRVMSKGESTVYTFVVAAYNPLFPIVKSEKEFTLTVYQKYDVPVENVYMKASPNIESRRLLNSLLTNEELMPTNFLYRPEDPNFGKATEVRYVHIYGVESTNLQSYIDAMAKNHYNRRLVLGEIKVAEARDSSGNVVYEAVYAEVIDDLINSAGKSLPQEEVWPYNIVLNTGPYYTSYTKIWTSNENVYTSYDIGTTKKLYPASLTNMRVEMLNNLAYVNDQDLLPDWMTSQQENGNTLGFVQAWVLCYALPGKGSTIKYNIENYWGYALNVIDFSVDRVYIDKSTTYNYNTTLLKPAWSQLPSASPTPNPLHKYDLPVLFPKKSISPKDSDN